MFKLQVRAAHLKNPTWVTLAILPSHEAAERDRDNRNKNAMVTLPMRIVPVNHSDTEA